MKSNLIIWHILIIVGSFSLSAEPVQDDARKKQFSDLTETDLTNLRKQAIEGDGVAANQLFLYLSVYGKNRSGVDGFEWLIIAAKNKNPQALISLKVLKDQGTIDEWLNEMIKSDKVEEDEKKPK